MYLLVYYVYSCVYVFAAYLNQWFAFVAEGNSIIFKLWSNRKTHLAVMMMMMMIIFTCCYSTMRALHSSFSFFTSCPSKYHVFSPHFFLNAVAVRMNHRILIARPLHSRRVRLVVNSSRLERLLSFRLFELTYLRLTLLMTVSTVRPMLCKHWKRMHTDTKLFFQYLLLKKNTTLGCHTFPTACLWKKMNPQQQHVSADLKAEISNA